MGLLLSHCETLWVVNLMFRLRCACLVVVVKNWQWNQKDAHNCLIVKAFLLRADRQTDRMNKWMNEYLYLKTEFHQIKNLLSMKAILHVLQTNRQTDRQTTKLKPMWMCCFQDVYETFNILMRRKPKENNFKVSNFYFSSFLLFFFFLFFFASFLPSSSCQSFGHLVRQ